MLDIIAMTISVQALNCICVIYLPEKKTENSGMEISNQEDENIKPLCDKKKGM